MEVSALRDATVIYHHHTTFSPSVFELTLHNHRRVLYLPGERRVCLLHADVRMPAPTLVSQESQIGEMSEEILTPPGDFYTAVVESVLTALWQSRAETFEYTADFFIGYYLGLRLWQTLITQLEFRMKYFSDEALRWIAETFKPQLDSGKLDVPSAGPIMAFGSFMIPLPAIPPHLDGTIVHLGAAYGQWRSLVQLITILGDNPHEFITWNFVIDYCFWCRMELFHLCRDKGFDYTVTERFGTMVIRDAERL